MVNVSWNIFVKTSPPAGLTIFGIFTDTYISLITLFVISNLFFGNWFGSLVNGITYEMKSTHTFCRRICSIQSGVINYIYKKRFISFYISCIPWITQPNFFAQIWYIGNYFKKSTLDELTIIDIFTDACHAFLFCIIESAIVLYLCSKLILSYIGYWDDVILI